MSIYVIRYGDLYKIGYSSKLAQRVSEIMRSIPGSAAVFIGHMPGDREVEAHLHMVFATSRFSGEWFQVTAELVAWCNLVLIKELPSVERERVIGSRRPKYEEQAAQTKEELRRFAALMWPQKNHGERTAALAERLGWRKSRLSGFYHGDGRNVLRSTEAEELRALASALDSSRAAGDDK
jgi:hypothetical protein